MTIHAIITLKKKIEFFNGKSLKCLKMKQQPRQTKSLKCLKLKQWLRQTSKTSTHIVVIFDIYCASTLVCVIFMKFANTIIGTPSEDLNPNASLNF